MISVGRIASTTTRPVGKTSFTGSASQACSESASASDKFTRSKDFQNEVVKLWPKVLQGIKKMHKFTGEVPNIIINAIGTGLVAPIFIKHNFLSKADDDTRTYSALRQPISAFLSVATQVGMLIPINKVISNMSNSGYFADTRFQKTGFEDIEYIKKQIKKECPNLNKTQIEELATSRFNENMERLVDKVKKAEGFDSIKFSRGKNGLTLSANDTEEILEQVMKDLESTAKEGSKEHGVIQNLKTAIKEKKPIKDLIKISKDLPNIDFAQKFAEKHVSNVKANMKGYNQIIGLVVSLAILPVSCSLLNYIYPRFIDTFFPKLSKKDKKKVEPQPQTVQATEQKNKTEVKNAN